MSAQLLASILNRMPTPASFKGQQYEEFCKFTKDLFRQFESLSASDAPQAAADAQIKAAIRVLEVYADSYKEMAQQSPGYPLVRMNSVERDIRRNMIDGVRKALSSAAREPVQEAQQANAAPHAEAESAPLRGAEGLDPAGTLTDEQCDNLCAQTMDRIAALKDMHALDLNPDITVHATLRRELIRAGYKAAIVGDAP